MKCLQCSTEEDLIKLELQNIKTHRFDYGLLRLGLLPDLYYYCSNCNCLYSYAKGNSPELQLVPEPFQELFKLTLLANENVKPK